MTEFGDNFSGRVRLAGEDSVPPTTWSCWVWDGMLLAGAYPGAPEVEKHERKKASLRPLLGRRWPHRHGDWVLASTSRAHDTRDRFRRPQDGAHQRIALGENLRQSKKCDWLHVLWALISASKWNPTTGDAAAATIIGIIVFGVGAAILVFILGEVWQLQNGLPWMSSEILGRRSMEKPTTIGSWLAVALLTLTGSVMALAGFFGAIVGGRALVRRLVR